MRWHQSESVFGEEPFSIAPVHFFHVSFNCLHATLKGDFAHLEKEHQLPDLSSLCQESSFATVALGWNNEGLGAEITTALPFSEVVYPEITRGDSFELMLDTRDVKTSGYNTRFCHHFFFLPEPFDGVQAGEITRFRTEDRHPLCDSNELKVNFLRKGGRSVLKVFIPISCLHGYDPEQFDRLGLTYRINRSGGLPQHFSAVDRNFQIEQQPSLWSSARLVSDANSSSRPSRRQKG